MGNRVIHLSSRTLISNYWLWWVGLSLLGTFLAYPVADTFHALPMWHWDNFFGCGIVLQVSSAVITFCCQNIPYGVINHFAPAIHLEAEIYRSYVAKGLITTMWDYNGLVSVFLTYVYVNVLPKLDFLSTCLWPVFKMNDLQNIEWEVNVCCKDFNRN